MHSIDGTSALPLEASRLTPLEWSTHEEAHPFVVPEWESIGLGTVSPQIMGRHFGVFGGTGSGKTESVVRPALRAALRHRADQKLHRASVLVIDPKFELAGVIESALTGQERTAITLDMRSGEQRISLFEGVRAQYADPVDAVSYTLRNCSPTYVRQADSTEQFWRSSGEQLIRALVLLDQASRRQCQVNLWSLALSDFPEQERRVLRAFGVTTKDTNYYASARAFCSAALNTPALIRRLATVCETHKLPQEGTCTLQSFAAAPENQRGSQIWMAFQYLEDLAHREVNAVIDLRPPGTGRGGEHLSIAQIVENGEVLLFSPGAGSPTHDIVGRVIKTKFFEASFARWNKERAIFYICDEFQHFITGDPQSGEQSFLDRCRAYRVSCVLATQSIASLSYALQQNGSGAGDADSALSIMISNLGNKFFFRNTDAEAQIALEQIFPRSPNPRDPSVFAMRPVSSLSVGECYYLFSDGRAGRGHVRLNGSMAPAEVDIEALPRVRLMGQMSFETVLDVCDRIERLVRFQRATEINIEIESPGGSMSALQYFAGRLAAWRTQGVRFHTTALLSALSAAAIALALGDVGCRRAHRFSRIMFHNGRYIPPQPVPITKEVALTLVEDLAAGDGVMESMLLEHLFPESRSSEPPRTIDFDSPALKELGLGISGVQVLDKSLFREIYANLTAQERFLSAEQTRLLGLIDCVI